MSKGRGLSNQDKQPQTAVPETAWQQTLRGAMAAPSWQALEQQQVLDAAPKISQVIRPWDWHVARPPTGGRPRKTTRTKAEGCHDQARCVLWECLAAPHVPTGSLPTFSSTVETCPSLAWLSELAPSSLIAGALWCKSRALGGSTTSLFARQVPEIRERHLGISPHFGSYYYQQQQKPQKPCIYSLLWARHYARCLVLIYINPTAPDNPAQWLLFLGSREKQCHVQGRTARKWQSWDVSPVCERGLLGYSSTTSSLHLLLTWERGLTQYLSQRVGVSFNRWHTIKSNEQVLFTL